MKPLRAYLDRRSRVIRLVLLVTVIVVSYLAASTVTPFWNDVDDIYSIANARPMTRHLLEDMKGGLNATTTTSTNETQKDPLFPKDLFTLEQRRNGAVVLHIIGMIYMFVALAIVCDEYFIPALDVIIEKLEIQDDVAGATFMAAGGSAPELFTSVIGVFVSFNNVGIGTIVGSAVFNILFVIGMCAMFSHSILNLTWWPLFRDVSFYSVSLLTLIGFFLNNRIDWWEAALQLGIYFCYVYFMRWNEPLEKWVKRHVTKNKVARVSSADQLVTSNGAPVVVAKPVTHTVQPRTDTLTVPSETAMGLSHRRASTPIIHSGSKFRHGLLQLMIHSIDPMNEDQQAKIDEKSTQIHAIASLKVLLDATRTNANASTPTGTATTTAGGSESDSQDYFSHGSHPGQVHHQSSTDGGQCSQVRDSVVSIKGERGMVTTESANQLNHVINHVETLVEEDVDEIVDIPENKDPVDLSWPDTNRKRITYVMLIPIMLPLWLTLPDTRRPEKKKWFACTFIGSIMWIAGFSYLMVWWATVAGETMFIPSEVMGLTFLAAGTSIPDLITSVIVARKGLGDMAVSSSIGSNIFDVTVGLPLPWLLYGIINFGDPVPVSSGGMACSIVLLFLMLIFVIMTIACCRWRMNKSLGITMFVLYFAFLAVSLLFEYGEWKCPL